MLLYCMYILVAGNFEELPPSPASHKVLALWRFQMPFIFVSCLELMASDEFMLVRTRDFLKISMYVVHDSTNPAETASG